jgi:hypothetical protein
VIRMKKILLLTLLLGLLRAIEGYGVGSLCYQVNHTPCSPDGKTRTCYLVAGSQPLNCHCLSGRWNCPVEP